MIQSMTGFGKGSVENEVRRISVEIRSINSKQADISVRLPVELRGIEMEVRKRLSTSLLRGKIDLFVTIEELTSKPKAHIDQELLKLYWDELNRISQETSIPLPSDPMRTLLAMPNIYTIKKEEEQGYDEITLNVVDEAINALIAFREQEGQALAAVFQKNINTISRLLEEIEPYEKERIENVRTKLNEGLQKYIETDYDRNRLEQELIYYIEKLDVNEEKNRLTNHLSYFIKTMNESSDGEGRKLGFIAQEIGREINTLGSKSNHAEMQKIVVRMKDELEQIKEQVLNVL